MKKINKILLMVLLIGCLTFSGCGEKANNISQGKSQASAVGSETKAAEDSKKQSDANSVKAEQVEKDDTTSEKGNTIRGKWIEIPEDIKQTMDGVSLPKDAKVKFADLAYLIIPHYNFEGGIENGFMVVNKKVADEVLDIFAELYSIKYPIEYMEIVDYFNASDFESIEANNTSAFNYRESTTGSGNLSMHAYGLAIDINPKINPYVDSSGKGSHKNAEEYWNRDISKWTSSIAKQAYIGRETKIYDIFVNKHGWTWGGDWASYHDYQHFEKKIN